MSTCILNEVGGTVSEHGRISVVVQQDDQMDDDAAALVQVRAKPRSSSSA